MKIYRILYILISLIPISILFLINKEVKITFDSYTLTPYLSYLLYLVVSILITWVFSLTFGKLDTENIECKSILLAESADIHLLATFLGYLFVGLSINNIWSLIFVYLLLVLLCSTGSVYLYNPIYQILGYRYYFIKIDTNKFLIMSKQRLSLSKINKPDSLKFNNLFRLNEFTYVEISKKEGK